MQLPVMPPVSPMLAKAVPSVPAADSVAGGLRYEPKWDGFRCIIFRDGDEVELGSRNTKPLTRYFPEVVAAVRAELPARCVVDGEIIIVGGRGLDFDALLQRIHPAESRVRALAAATPASFVAFDLLAEGDDALLETPFVERHERLVAALPAAGKAVHLTPTTEDEAVARQWFDSFEGAGLDGIIGKPLTGPYVPGKRTMIKVKHERTADCVVAGFRWHKDGPVVGSLLLGLYDTGGTLHHVGVASAFTAKRRQELVEELAAYRVESLAGHPWADWAQGSETDRLPGAQSRWNGGKDLSWQPLRPDLVAEVAYDHMQGDRFRHATQFRRWRTDRDPGSCTYAQLERPLTVDLATVLAS